MDIRSAAREGKDCDR